MPAGHPFRRIRTASRDREMKRVQYWGRPAGAFAAERLASAGLRRLCSTRSWPGKARGGAHREGYRRYPFLLDNDLPKRLVAIPCSPRRRAGAARLSLREPLVVYSAWT